MREDSHAKNPVVNTVDRIPRSIARRREDVILHSETEGLREPRSVGLALRRLAAQLALVRLGVGVYAKAKPSVLTGKLIRINPFEVLGHRL